MRILITGLPRSGKSTLAKKIAEKTGFAIVNGDDVRRTYNDTDFSVDGRLRQARRIRELADAHDNVICDFICPTKETRSIVDADFVIYMNTEPPLVYEDTNRIFQPPINCDVRVLSHNDTWVDFILEKLTGVLSEH